MKLIDFVKIPNKITEY